MPDVEGHVKRSSINSAADQKTPDRVVEIRTAALRVGSDRENPPTQNSLTKSIRNLKALPLKVTYFVTSENRDQSGQCYKCWAFF